ncbi:hypothetical protein KC845_02455 [Candidatus Kaiserbacteria bacterium]|nr:hypothetical protein [Candidatus Kaiserbacteria bacterium]
MTPELQEQIDQQNIKIDAVYESVEKVRKYLLVIMWLTLGMVILPLLAALFIVPALINSYTSTLEGLI